MGATGSASLGRCGPPASLTHASAAPSECVGYGYLTKCSTSSLTVESLAGPPCMLPEAPVEGGVQYHAVPALTCPAALPGGCASTEVGACFSRCGTNSFVAHWSDTAGEAPRCIPAPRQYREASPSGGRKAQDLDDLVPAHVFREHCSEFVPKSQQLGRRATVQDEAQTLFDDLSRAVRKGDFRKVVDVVALGANFNLKTPRGLTPLMLAAMSPTTESLAIARFLIEAGAEVATRDEECMTALLHASRNSNMPVVNALLKARAKLHVCNRDGKTAPMLAVMEGGDEIAQKLLLKKAPMNKKDDKGWSVLYHACHDRRYEMVVWLLDRHANPRDKATNGRTAFMLAMAQGDQEMGKVLLEYHASPSAQDDDGNTALMLALQANEKESAVWLIHDAGTDVMLHNKQGQSASDFARAAGLNGIAELIGSLVFNLMIKMGKSNFKPSEEWVMA